MISHPRSLSLREDDRAGVIHMQPGTDTGINESCDGERYLRKESRDIADKPTGLRGALNARDDRMSNLRVLHRGINNRLEARPFGSRRRMSGQPGLEKERIRR
jgi:hypothetical protein